MIWNSATSRMRRRSTMPGSPSGGNGRLVTRASGRQPSSIQSAMKSISASATRLPPHMKGGNRLPSNGTTPRSAWINPELALRLMPSLQHACMTGAIRRMPNSLASIRSSSGSSQKRPSPP